MKPCLECDGKGYYVTWQDRAGQAYANVYQVRIFADCEVCDGTGEVEE